MAVRGIPALAADCHPLLAMKEGQEGYRAVADKFTLSPQRTPGLNIERL